MDFLCRKKQIINITKDPTNLDWVNETCIMEILENFLSRRG